MAERRALAAMSDVASCCLGPRPGAGLERLRRRLIDKDDWIFDEETFADAVRSVGDEFVDGVLAGPVRRVDDGGPRHLRLRLALDRPPSSPRCSPDPDPHVRSAYVRMGPQAWHEVSVLKFVHQYFILDRPDLAMFQRGQDRTIEPLVIGFDHWLSDRPTPPGRRGG